MMDVQVPMAGTFINNSLNDNIPVVEVPIEYATDMSGLTHPLSSSLRSYEHLPNVPMSGTIYSNLRTSMSSDVPSSSRTRVSNLDMERQSFEGSVLIDVPICE